MAAWAHGLGLRWREVEKAQHQSATGVVGDPDLQRPTPAKGDLCIGDDAIHQRLIADPQLTEGAQPGAVLIAAGQVEQQVLNGLDAQAPQSLEHARADALESFDADLVQLGLIQLGLMGVLGTLLYHVPRTNSGDDRSSRMIVQRQIEIATRGRGTYEITRKSRRPSATPESAWDSVMCSCITPAHR
jgi:hypothetical protein